MLNQLGMILLLIGLLPLIGMFIKNKYLGYPAVFMWPVIALLMICELSVMTNWLQIIISIIFWCMLGLYYCYFWFLFQIKISNRRPIKKYDYIVILGAGISAGITKTLKNRLDAGIELWRETHKRIIVSGGQGSDEPMAESHMMKNYLIARIPQADIFEENQSTNTYQNLIYSKRIFDQQPIIIVSSDFHIYRIRQIAQQLKLNFSLKGAKSNPRKWRKTYFREYLSWLWIHRYKFLGLLVICVIINIVLFQYI